MNLRTILPAIVLGAATFSGLTVPASAHHSHAMYDTAKVDAIKGVVKSYDFGNPHVYLFLVVKKPNGKAGVYDVEMSFTQNMERQGIGPTTFKVGDSVTLYVNPLRSGAFGGSYVGAIDAQGHKHGRYFKKHKS